MGKVDSLFLPEKDMLSIYETDYGLHDLTIHKRMLLSYGSACPVKSDS